MTEEKRSLPKELITATGEECLRGYKGMTSHLQERLMQRAEEKEKFLRKSGIEVQLEKFACELARGKSRASRIKIRKQAEEYLSGEITDEAEREKYQRYFEQTIKIFINPPKHTNSNPYGAAPSYWR